MPGTVNHTELTIIDSENYTEIIIVRLIISNIDKSGQCPGTKVLQYLNGAALILGFMSKYSTQQVLTHIVTICFTMDSHE